MSCASAESRVPAAGEPAQYASAHLLLHRGEVFGCQRGGLGEVDLPVLAQRKHPVDRAAVEVDMGIQHAAKALHEAHRAQPRLGHPQEDVQNRAERLGIALQEVAQALRDRQHPFKLDPPGAILSDASNQLNLLES
jgi:hypothetical protein